MIIILKLVISASIVGISTYIGTSKARKLKEREYILRDMITFLKLVENEIKYMMNILPNAYEIARQKLNTELKIKIGNIVIDMLLFISCSSHVYLMYISNSKLEMN